VWILGFGGLCGNGGLVGCADGGRGALFLFALVLRSGEVESGEVESGEGEECVEGWRRVLVFALRQQKKKVKKSTKYKSSRLTIQFYYTTYTDIYMYILTTHLSYHSSISSIQ